MKKKNKALDGLTSNFWISLISICAIFIILLTVGIVAFSNRKAVVVEEEKDGGYVTLNYSSDVNGLAIVNATPVTDLVGIKNNYYFDFSVVTDLKEASKIEYEISLTKDSKTSTLSDKDIKVYLEKEDSGTYTKFFGPAFFTPLNGDSLIGSKKGDMVIADVKKINSETDNYRLRIWLSNEGMATKGNYSVEINIHGIAK